MSEMFPVSRLENIVLDQGLIDTNEVRSDEITGGSITEQMNEVQAIKDARDAEVARQVELTQDKEDYLAANERDAYGDAYRDVADQAGIEQVSDEQITPDQDQEDYRGPNEFDPLGDAHREAMSEDEPGDVRPDNTVLKIDKRKPIVYVNIDQSYDSKTNARDMAERRHAAEMERGSGIGGFLNKIWKGNLAKLYYINKYANEAEQANERSQNINYGSGMSAEDQARATRALFEQYGNDDENDSAIHFGAGEEKRVHGADGEYATGIKDIIRRNFDGEYATQDDFIEAHKRFVQQYRENHSNDGSTNEGLVEVNNLFDIADAVRSSVEHGESLDNVLQNMIIVSGESRTGVRTEAELDVVDRIVEKFSKSKIGMLISPNTVAVASSIALSIANFGGRSLFSAATKAFVPGAAASLWAGAREYSLSKKDRATNSRERARGETSQSNDRLRNDMESTRYETVSAEELMNSIDSSCFEGMFDDCDEEQSQSMVLSVLGNIAAIETRIRLSDESSADFISYANVLVGTERLELDRKLAEAKVLLNDQVETNDINLDDLYRKFGLSEYGPDQMTDMGSNKLNEIVDIISGAFEDSIEDDVTAKDASFKILKAKRVAVATAKAFVTGAVIGTIVGELLPNRFGIIDKMLGREIAPGQTVTIPEALFGGNITTSAVEINPTNLANLASTHGEIPLSGGGKLVATGDNLFSMFGSNNAELVSDLKINPDGSFSEEAIKQLSGHGIDVASNIEGVEVVVNQATEVSKADFVQNHLSEMTKITHDIYYDNDTPAPVFEKDELGLHWGANGGVTDNGYQLNISTMTSDGSYHEGFSVDAKTEDLKAALTVDDATGSHVIILDIDKQIGNIDISKGSLAANFFNVDADGQVGFTGASLEVVQVSGIDAEGVTHINPLAAIEGINNTEPLMDNVPTKAIENHVVHNFTENHNVVIPPFIPVEPRETMKTTKRNRGPEYGYYNNYMTEAEQAKLAKERSPRLRMNPLAILDNGKELNWYKKQLNKDEGAYLAEIEEEIVKNPELNHIKPDIKAVVTIPVGAVGEADNIYRTLSLYSQQDPEAVNDSLVLLHVNWFDSNENVANDAAAIQKTKDEIERARADFPHLNIATIESIWSREKMNNGGYGNGIIGHVTRKLYDTAMMSIERAISDGEIPANRDILLIRNDADAQGMDSKYLSSMIGDFEKNPQADVFTGAIRWETARHHDLPGLAFASNFREIMHITARRRGFDSYSPTVGINTAVRMSTFAAVSGVGHDERETGAGTDDLTMGGRIRDARMSSPISNNNGVYSYINRFKRKSSNMNGKSVYGKENFFQRHVMRAGIDSKADRLERYYLPPKDKNEERTTIADSWNEFDKGGYKKRDEGLDSLNRKESYSEPNVIVENIERNISAMITKWYQNEMPQVRASLAVMLPLNIKSKPSYTIQKLGDENIFKLSEDGAKWVVNHLQKDRDGRPNTIGQRVRKNLYGENRVPGVVGRTRFVK